MYREVSFKAYFLYYVLFVSILQAKWGCQEGKNMLKPCVYVLFLGFVSDSCLMNLCNLLCYSTFSIGI